MKPRRRTELIREVGTRKREARGAEEAVVEAVEALSRERVVGAVAEAIFGIVFVEMSEREMELGCVSVGS